MTTTMRTAAGATAVTLVLALAGCGGDDGGSAAPASASEEDFCAPFRSLWDDLAELGPDPAPADLAEAVQAIAEEMAETGTPADIPDDARAGFEIMTEAIQGLGDDVSAEDFSNLADDLDESDREKYDAFGEYVAETCDV